MIDTDKIDVANHEFTGEEIGKLLMQSINQMKNKEIVREHHIPVNISIEARQSIGLSQKEQKTHNNQER